MNFSFVSLHFPTNNELADFPIMHAPEVLPKNVNMSQEHFEINEDLSQLSKKLENKEGEIDSMLNDLSTQFEKK